MKKSAGLCITLFLFCLAIPAFADDVIIAEVVGVSVGYTITVLQDQTQNKVWLYGVHSPENR